MTLRNAWEAQANNWIAWARKPGHDSYWSFHRDQFLQLLPSAGQKTADIGCGEGRLTRHLKSLGHNVIGIEGSPTLAAAASEMDPSMDIRLADAAALPLKDSCIDLAIAFMSLQDVDAMPQAIAEISRVLMPLGKLCFAIVHPINSAGRFSERTPEAPFVVQGSYLQPSRYADEVERDGLAMTFHSEHRPLESYVRALEDAGLLIESLREPSYPEAAVVAESSRRWQRLPLFLHIRALKP